MKQHLYVFKGPHKNVLKLIRMKNILGIWERNKIGTRGAKKAMVVVTRVLWTNSISRGGLDRNARTKLVGKDRQRPTTNFRNDINTMWLMFIIMTRSLVR